MFEIMGTIFNQVNILGYGSFFMICAVLFGIARGMSKRKRDMTMIALIYAMFGMITFWRGSIEAGGLLIVSAVLVFIYGIMFMPTEMPTED